MHRALLPAALSAVTMLTVAVWPALAADPTGPDTAGCATATVRVDEAAVAVVRAADALDAAQAAIDDGLTQAVEAAQARYDAAVAAVAAAGDGVTDEQRRELRRAERALERAAAALAAAAAPAPETTALTEARESLDTAIAARDTACAAPEPTDTTTAPPATTTAPPSNADLSDLDCGDFVTREDAQVALEGGQGDPARLDGDGDGLACEDGVGAAALPVGGVATGDGSLA